MEIENVQKYVGKRVLLILKNNFKYTTTIPKFKKSTFCIIDKFGLQAEIDCDAIAIIQLDERGENDK